MEISQQRWRSTQKNEQMSWEGKKADSDNLAEAHRHLWQNYLQFINQYITIKAQDKILDIGCGPWGLINYLSAGERYGFDPLMDYFAKEFNLPKDVKFISGAAEEPPFNDNFFDLIIISNVLDHTKQPFQILSGIRRMLKTDGLLVLTIDCYGPIYKWYRIMKEKFGIKDPYHPFSFSSAQIKKMLLSNNFALIDQRINLKYKNPAWLSDRPKRTVKGRIYDWTIFQIERLWDKDLLPAIRKKELILICKKTKADDSYKSFGQN
jgi:SAM-dependent methyltransferase